MVDRWMVEEKEKLVREEVRFRVVEMEWVYFVAVLVVFGYLFSFSFFSFLPPLGFSLGSTDEGWKVSRRKT